MRKKNLRMIFRYLALCCVTAVFVACQTNSSPERIVYNLNAGWGFYRGDSLGLDHSSEADARYIPVTIPHIMQLEPKHSGGDCIYDGVGWYRRYFTLTQEEADRRVAVAFEGVMTNCEIYLDGKKLATHHGGYMGFTVDLTGQVQAGVTHMLAVRVSAEYDPLTPPGKPQANLDFYYHSGIYRDVNLVITDKLHITDPLEENEVAGGGIFVTYPKVSKEEACVEAKVHLRNRYDRDLPAQVRYRLINADGKEVARTETETTLPAGKAESVTAQLQVKQPALWHPYHPHLYTLEVSLVQEDEVCDRVTQTIGIRTIHYTAKEGFFINGERLYLVGGNRHQCYPYIGDAASNSMQVREVIDMKRGGYNAVRAAHYPHDPAFLDACDKYGLLVVECIPGWQYFSQDPVFTDRLEDVGREMVRRDRNHPSIILWETALNETYYPLSVVERIWKAAHEEYPGDQFYTAGDYLGHEDTEPYYEVFYKQVAGFPKEGGVMGNSLDNQVNIKPLFTREWGDGVGEKPRVSLVENEYEQYRQARGRYVLLDGKGYFDWCMLDANPHMGGHFLWSYNDYTRGAEEETMYSGVVDLNRYPKFSYYQMQSMRTVSLSQPPLYKGPMIFIASYNSSADYPSSTSEINVFSNCEEVHLYRNGKLIGKQTREEAATRYPHIVNKGGSAPFIFDAGGYEAGELFAEGYVEGEKKVSHKVATPGQPHHIELYTPSYGLTPVADGSDMIPVYAKICDEAGNLVNQSNARVTFSISGEGTIIGDRIERIGVNPQAVEGGVGFVFVRTTQQPGSITLTASAEGLQSGELTLKTQPTTDRLLPDVRPNAFKADEETNVVIKDSKFDREVLAWPKVEVVQVETTSSQEGLGKEHIIDGDDFSWWVAGNDQFPQSVTLKLAEPTIVQATRIRFQKDSDSYTHKVESSMDGKNWESVYERTCTGWEFKPVRFERKMQYLRLTIEKTNEGRAGLAEITLFR